MNKLTPEQTALVNAHLEVAQKLAGAHARRVHATAERRDDILGEAYLALCQAAQTWDPTRGPFRARAITKIKWALELHDENETNIVYISDNAHRVIRKARQAIAAGATTIPEVAQALKVNEAKITELWEYIRPNTISLDQTNTHDDSPRISITDPNPSPEDTVIDKLINAEVRQAINNLPGNQPQIVKALIGLLTGEPMTAEQVMEHLNVSRDELIDATEAAATTLEGTLKGIR
jgi:DNA-directed RNA polymerase specialized sigma subunit